MKLGIIEDTTLKGRKIVLEPRNNLPDNIWLVENGTFPNGSPIFSYYCLVCEKQIPSNGCPKCNKKDGRTK